MIVSSCPLLSNLDITIKRSMSNRSETKCYEALSTIRNLKKLQIRFDGTYPRDPSPPSDDWDEFNKTRSGYFQFYNGHLENVLVNSAVDETLARSIWGVIYDNTHNQLLESLKVTCAGIGFGGIYTADLQTISGNLSRSYLITASHSDDGDKLKVVELTKKRREEMDELKRKHEEAMLEKWGQAVGGPFFKVFERLWPFEEGGKNWREAWRSWPLQRSE